MEKNKGLLLYCFIDIDECSEDVHNCAQLCSNTAGSFTCSCQSGYRISTDDRQCTGMFIIIMYEEWDTIYYSLIPYLFLEIIYMY